KVLKIPYPGTEDACAAVTEICGDIPWAVLSAGVDHATFLTQVEISLRNGASGVIAGRSLWKDCISLDRNVSKEKLSSVAVSRLHDIQQLLNKYSK
ncbi:tagatose-bisphosphate aldolase, partial [Acinetobacter baumannii]|nr:tagatose-bisphosphate aldolase [Acinetobacter baumannii]